MLAFQSPELVDTAKVAILGGSLLAGAVAAVGLKMAARRKQNRSR
ncbi:MAG: hypothetical protein M3505_10315 [Verrucomicrobiota bacterium]|nr:hypothetical protein [Verrucomicrobiota bacterium]